MKPWLGACLFFVALLMGFAPEGKAAWLDQSHQIFLPPQVSRKASAYQEFPIFWWNFLVLQFDDKEIPWNDLQNACGEWAQAHSEQIGKIPCSQSLKGFRDFAHDWIHDLPLREQAPAPAAFSEQMNRTWARASLPIGSDLLALLRQDPLGRLDDLLAHLQKNETLQLENHQGFFTDQSTHRVLIPVQLAFSPSEAGRMGPLINTTSDLCSKIPGCQSGAWIGPHASGFENETRVKSDLAVVSGFSLLFLLLLIGFLLWTRRLRVLLLLPPLGLAMGLATLFTVWVFGSIHGLVLAFGPGIVGLALDYGLHACFMGPDSKRTWLANWLGILTTLVVLLVMLFSQIPLIRELMFFSAAGLSLAFLFFYLLMRKAPQLFRSQAYPLRPTKSQILGIFSSLLILCGAGLFFLNLNLDLRQMNFASPRTIELQNWLFGSDKSRTPWLLMGEGDAAVNASQTEKKWADQNGIGYQGIASELPPSTEQQTHLQSWVALFCPTKKLAASPSQEHFFAPFFQQIDCTSLTERSQHPPTLSPAPAYLKDLTTGSLWVSFFLPKDEAQAALVKAQFPEASSPADLFSMIPKVLFQELVWMLPLSLLAAWLILFVYYRDLPRSCLAVVPFFTGLGAYALISLIWHLPVTFISIIGLIMVFGMSLDYGVFVVNFIELRDPESNGVWSALSLCGYVTVTGFLPLLFAHHPVLFQLGNALTWGSVGTYLGSVFGLPWLYKMAGRA